MIGMNELLLLIVVGGIIFFFGKDKVKDWLKIGKEIKAEAETPITINTKA